MTTVTAPPRISRQWIALGLVFVAMGLSTAMATPYLTLFLTDEVHASATQVGAFLIVTPIASVIVSAVIGRISDRLPDRQGLMLVAATSGAVASGLTAVVRDYWIFLLITVVLISVAFSMMPQVFAYAREALSGSAMQMSTLRTLFSVAWVAGPPLAAVLLSTGGFRLTYSVAAVMYAFSGVVVLVALRRPKTDAGPDTPAPVVDGVDAPRRILWLSVAAFVLMWAYVNLGVQTLPLLITRDMGLDIANAGLLLGLCAGLEIPLMLGLGYLATRVPVHLVLILGTVCGTAYMVLVTVSHSMLPLALGQVLHAAAISALNGPGIVYMQDMLPRQRGRASTLFTNTYPVGALLAGPVLGAAQYTGYRMPFAVGAVLCAGAGGLLLLSRNRSTVEARDRSGAAIV